MILLDYRDKRPLYEQMVEKLEHLIVSGGLEPLTKMPSVRSLAMELSVNPNTVQRAYAQLEQDGYLYTVSGRGSFVTAQEDWRENRQAKVLGEWQTLTRQAREAGIPGERLCRELSGIYGAEALTCAVSCRGEEAGAAEDGEVET
ncbi:MAG: GntR family transcriptional regulator [Lachnospiraceae bacterium]|nr:GntR family transcriptional regulator [Lachnospiraceae bacterium]